MRSVRFRILLEHYLAFESYWNAVEGAERDWVCTAMSQRFATIARCLSTIAIIAIIGFAVMFGLFAAIVAVILWYLSYLSWCLLRWLIMVIEGYAPAVEDFHYAVRGERDCVFEISPDGVIIREEVAWLPPGDSTIAHSWSEILEICSTDQHAFFCWNRKRAYIVPENAFPSRRDFEDFVSTAMKWRQEAFESFKKPDRDIIRVPPSKN